jgi:hypothetical protein
MNRKVLALSVLAVLLLTTTALSASTAPSAIEVQRYVIGGGGGRSEAGSYVLRGTAGQPVAGRAANYPYGFCAGFWPESCKCTAIFLPLILRE